VRSTKFGHHWRATNSKTVGPCQKVFIYGCNGTGPVCPPLAWMMTASESLCVMTVSTGKGVPPHRSRPAPPARPMKLNTYVGAPVRGHLIRDLAPQRSSRGDITEADQHPAHDKVGANGGGVPSYVVPHTPLFDLCLSVDNW
jgi:hypothetical protein